METDSAIEQTAIDTPAYFGTIRSITNIFYRN